MAINPQIPLSVQTLDVGQAFNNALLNMQRAQSMQQQSQQFQSQQQQNDLKAAVTLAGPIRASLSGGDLGTARSLISRLPMEAQTEALQMLERGDTQGLINLATQLESLAPRLGMTSGQAIGTEQAAFESLISGLSPEEQDQARRVKLGLSPRAVGSAAQTITERGTAEEVGETEAVLAQRRKFGELTGQSRAKAIDEGFDRIQSLSQNIANLDKAVEAVNQGAGTGAIERRFPSIRSASVMLDQIQGELALDVVGAVTFGSLSESELDLAKQIALPAGLEGPELVQWLRDKQEAQRKLLSYFEEQIDFLDQGGTVAGFLRMKRRQQGQPQATQSSEQAPVQTAPQQPSSVLRFDAQGNLVQ